MNYLNQIGAKNAHLTGPKNLMANSVALYIQSNKRSAFFPPKNRQTELANA